MTTGLDVAFCVVIYIGKPSEFCKTLIPDRKKLEMSFQKLQGPVVQKPVSLTLG